MPGFVGLGLGLTLGLGLGLGLTVGVGEGSGVGDTVGSEGVGLEVICGAVNKKILAVPLGTLEITFSEALDFSC